MAQLVTNIHNHVLVTDSTVPLTGIYDLEHHHDGWRWDMRHMENLNVLSTQYDNTLGGHEHGLLDATLMHWWQSGVVMGIEYYDTTSYQQQDFDTWTPRFYTGQYSLFFDSRRLYSDYSYSSVMTIDGMSGFTFHELRPDAVYQTIQVRTWMRDENLIFKHREFEYVEEFTGVIDGGARVDPLLNIALTDKRYYEYRIVDDEVVLNQAFEVLVDTPEPHGQHVPGRNIFLKYFPIKDESVELVGSFNGVDSTWTEVTSFALSTSSDKHYVVDYDLGIIDLGGYQAPDLVLKTAITGVTTVVEVYPSRALEEYGPTGILVLGTEQILYGRKAGNKFLNCTRGYNSTTAAAHAVGAVVMDMQHGAITNEGISVTYTAVPEIRYEVSNHNLRSANRSRWLDIKPTANAETDNIVQILSKDLDLDRIVLSTNAPNIVSNIYGPLHFGIDSTQLTATAYDSSDNVVDGLNLTIEILEGPGSLNGFGTSWSAITNTLGQIYAFYNAPYNPDDVYKKVTSVTQAAGNTSMVVQGLPAIVDVKNIWTFQILKHDKVLGTKGLKVLVDDANNSSEPYGASYIDLPIAAEERWENGFLYFSNSGVKTYVSTRHIFPITLTTGMPGARLYLGTDISSDINSLDPVYLFESQATEWSPALLNGVKVILYEWNNTALHPLTGEAGAYSPLHPQSAVGGTIVFNGRNLPIPAPSSWDSNLGGYVVVAPAEAVVQAWGRDPVSGRIIRSNKIKLQIQLSPIMTGVSYDGELPIPHGFRLISQEFNVGSGLGGANFITINPAAEGINQLCISDEL